MSVVIPTLDAGRDLRATLNALAGAPMIREIVVADGGSADDTATIARAAGARVVVAPRGRGTQLAAGAGAASGDWLLFLHADCRPAVGWQQAVAAFVASPGAADRAGYFAFALDDQSQAARRLERIVAWRCRRLGLPYGDQGLLIARALYDRVGGFAALPLMEDVDLVRRLGRRRLTPLAAPLYASARRYREGGYIRRPLRNLICLSLYFLGVPARHLARLYGVNGRMVRRHLVLFVREPRWGVGKRRLARDIGDAAALRFERAMLGLLLRRLGRDRRWRPRLAVTPDHARRRARLWPPGVPIAAQGAGDLGTRMRRALASCPPGPAVLVGSDIPALAAHHIAGAFRLLGQHDLVFGPAADGGFWLVGARRSPRLPLLFGPVRWSGPQALADVLGNLPAGVSVGFAACLDDVDDGPSWRRFAPRRAF